jgi:hypothetical protein
MKKMILVSLVLMMGLGMQAQVRVLPKMSVGDKFVYDCATDTKNTQKPLTAKSTMEFYVSQKTGDGYIVDMTMTEMTSSAGDDLMSIMMNITEGMLKGVKIQMAVNAKGQPHKIVNFGEVRQKCANYIESLVDRIFTENPQVANVMTKEAMKEQCMSSVTEEVLMKGIVGTPTNPLFLSGKTITDGMEDTYVNAQDIKMKRSFKVLGANKFSSHAECNMSKEDLKAFIIQKVAEAQPDKLETFKSGVDALLESGSLYIDASENSTIELNANGWPKVVDYTNHTNIMGQEITVSCVETLR